MCVHYSLLTGSHTRTHTHTHIHTRAHKQSEKHANRLMEAMDKDHDSFVSRQEFMDFMTKAQEDQDGGVLGLLIVGNSAPEPKPKRKPSASQHIDAHDARSTPRAQSKPTGVSAEKERSNASPKKTKQQLRKEKAAAAAAKIEKQKKDKAQAFLARNRGALERLIALEKNGYINWQDADAFKQGLASLCLRDKDRKNKSTIRAKKAFAIRVNSMAIKASGKDQKGGSGNLKVRKGGIQTSEGRAISKWVKAEINILRKVDMEVKQQLKKKEDLEAAKSKFLDQLAGKFNKEFKLGDVAAENIRATVAKEAFTSNIQLARVPVIIDTHIKRQEANPYAVVRKLGAGGFGSVWLGRRKSDGREMAVKVMEGVDKMAAEDFRELQREIDGLIRCESCPQICHFFSSKVIDTQFWIAMEFCDVGSLNDVIKRAMYKERPAKGMRKVIAAT